MYGNEYLLLALVSSSLKVVPGEYENSNVLSPKLFDAPGALGLRCIVSVDYGLGG